jgi:endonuclease YncB( thermonuclease family)
VTGPAYRYRAVVVEVHDGDSITADVDLGLHVWRRHESFRLLGCNARELEDPGGVEARDNLAAIVTGTELTLTSVKPDKYGDRMDCVITLPDGSDLVTGLIAEQWAAPWSGRGVKPLPPWPRTVTT